MAQESKNIISLKTADGNIHEVSPVIVKQMQTVQPFVEQESFEFSTVIPLPNVESIELSNIIKYLNYHYLIEKTSTSPTSDDGKKMFNTSFVKELSHYQMIQLIIASSYLHVKDLLDFMCLTVADLIKDKSNESVREFFGIVNDITQEEKDECLKNMMDKYCYN